MPPDEREFGDTSVGWRSFLGRVQPSPASVLEKGQFSRGVLLPLLLCLSLRAARPRAAWFLVETLQPAMPPFVPISAGLSDNPWGPGSSPLCTCLGPANTVRSLPPGTGREARLPLAATRTDGQTDAAVRTLCVAGKADGPSLHPARKRMELMLV